MNAAKKCCAIVYVIRAARIVGLPPEANVNAEKMPVFFITAPRMSTRLVEALVFPVNTQIAEEKMIAAIKIAELIPCHSAHTEPDSAKR